MNQNLSSISITAKKHSATTFAILGDSWVESQNSPISFSPQLAGFRTSLISGHSGYRSDQLIQYIPDVISSGASDCLIFCGLNDIGQDKTPLSFYDNVCSIVRGLSAGGVKSHLVYIPPHSTYLTQYLGFNIALYKVATTLGCFVHDVLSLDQFVNTNGTQNSTYSTDGIHLNMDGASVFASLLAPKLASPKCDFPPILSNGAGIMTNPTFTGDSNLDGLADDWEASVEGVKTLTQYIGGNKQNVIYSGIQVASKNLRRYMGTTAHNGSKLVLFGGYALDNNGASATGVLVNHFIRLFKSDGNMDIVERAPCGVSGTDFKFWMEFDVPSTTTAILYEIEMTSVVPSALVEATVTLNRVELFNLTSSGLV